MAQPADPIRRPAPVTPTSPIAASSSAAIGGSVWPTRSGSVPPVLDTGAHLAARIGSGAVDVGLNPRDIVRAEGGLDLVAVGQRGPGASDAALSGSVDTGRCAASGILLRLAL